MTSLCPHPTGAYISSLLPLWMGGALLQRMLKGAQPGRQPHPQPGSSPLCKGNHWRSKCPCLQMEGKVPLPMDWWVLASCPRCTSWHPCWGAIIVEKQKIFVLDNGACFSVLPFSPGPRSNDKSYHLGQIWPAPRALLYPTSGLLLGRPPLLSFFPHIS
jgi:hypothetical protein